MTYTQRPTPDDSSSDTLLSYTPLLRQLLLTRGVTTSEQAELFLHPDWERDTHNSYRMKDMGKAVDRIMSAVEHDETIALWSDYDMDGIPGAVTLYEFFRVIEYDKVVHYTPHRNKDGFGLNREGVEELAEQNVTLIITIDCGTADVEHVAFANTKNIDVIITDHHLISGKVPSAFAILNPKQESCAYPEKMLCGAGVAFKLTQALVKRTREHEEENETKTKTIPVGWEKWLLDMVGMATIADMVPLTGENRTFAHYGLLVLRKSRRLGLQALLKRARTDQRFLTEDDVAFTIAPRINAASRMGHARDAFALLSSTDPSEAGALAESLDSVNTERKTVVATMKREIKRRLKKHDELKPVIVLGNPEWKPSLLGLVAGSLAEEFERPVFLWGREEGTTIKGSCRSDGSCSIFALMESVQESFLEYGGHMIAGGFSLEEERVHTLEQVLSVAYQTVSQTSAMEPKYFDEVLSLEQVTWETYREVAQLGPFGVGNHKPLFLFRGVILDAVRTFGKGNEHLELCFKKDSGGVVKAISFFRTKDSFKVPFQASKKISFVAHLEASYFRGRPELRLRLVDVLPESA